MEFDNNPLEHCFKAFGIKTSVFNGKAMLENGVVGVNIDKWTSLYEENIHKSSGEMSSGK